jgi:hypothetical protein
VNESDPKPLDLQSALAKVRRPREENVRLRGLLQEHGIQIPVQSTNEIPVTTSVLPSAHAPVLKAEQRIALFRSLFHGREDVYALRWENADGRSGYMPKADRDWKAYLRAKDQDRKKVDRGSWRTVVAAEKEFDVCGFRSWGNPFSGVTLFGKVLATKHSGNVVRSDGKDHNRSCKQLSFVFLAGLHAMNDQKIQLAFALRTALTTAAAVARK